MAKIARVQMPDGRVARFEVPDDATQEDVVREASRLKAQPKEQPKPRNRGLGVPMLDKALSAANEALIGIPQGVENIGAFFTDPLVRMVGGKQMLENEREARANRWDTASRTISPNANPAARTVGQIGGAMLVPVPKIPGAGALAKPVNRAIQGAMGGAAVRDSDQGAAVPATIGAAANVLLPPVLSKIAQSAPGRAVGRAVGRAAAPIVSAADDASEAILSRAAPAAGLPYAPVPQLPPPTTPVTAPLAGLGRKAEARSARFKALGIDEPTTGMVTRDPNAFSFEQNAAKIQGAGDDLQRQIRNVESSLVEKGRELVRNSGGARGAEGTGAAVQDVLDTKRTEMQKVTSGLYTAVREARGEVSAGPLNPLREALDDPMLTDNPAFDQMREGIMRRMRRLGMAGDTGLLRNDSVATVGQAEELRKFIGGLGDSRDPAVKMVRSRLIDALDDGVVDTVGDDAFKAARASARARFEEFNKTFAGRVADEKIAPELLTKRVLGDGVPLSDLRAMRKSMLTGTPEQQARGTEAWKGLRAQAIDDLLSRSTNDEGKLLGNQLFKDFYKQSAKFRVLLDPADYKQLRRLVQASRDATVAPPMSSVNYSNTAITQANLFDGMKEPVKQGWAKFLIKTAAKHGAAFAAGGPPANVGVIVGEQVAASAAQKRAADKFARQIELARNPEQVAALVRSMEKVAESNPAVAEILKRFNVGGGLVGGGSSAAVAGH